MSEKQHVIHSNISWDQYFISMAYLVAMKSKDPSSKVGAIIVGPDHEIRSTGYNGLPRSVIDKEHRYSDRSYKYLAGNHAEENAIANAARIGMALQNCIMYVPWMPCSYCAKLIIQSGITEIVYHRQFPGNFDKKNENWKNSMSISREILQEATMNLREFDGELLNIKSLYSGKEWLK